MKATLIRAIFHTLNMPRLFCTIIECTKAVSTSHGIKPAFSTGSHAQNPPHPSIVYAHQPPSSRPEPRMPQETRAHVLPVSTHSSPVLPASKEPMAKAKGMETVTSPVINMGGWTNMPGWVRRGFIPRPSGTATAVVSKGLARKMSTARKKARTPVIIPQV